jgi:trigger factor
VSDINAAVNVEDISPVKKKICFDIPWVDVKNELDTVYRKVGRTAKVRGFRPGKIPREILEIHCREQVEEETVANLVNRYYWNTLRERDIQAVTQPQVEQKGIEKEKDFIFSATIEVEPNIEPKNYLGLELVKDESIVTDQDLETRLQEIRQLFATMEDLKEDRGLVEGDFAELDFSGFIAGDKIKELTSENYLLEIGSKTFVPGFEDQLIGMKKGETRSIIVKFPENYHAQNHLAGKDIEFTVKILGIRVKKMPEIDDNFIKNFERYESLESMRADIRSNLEDEKKRKSESELHKNIGEKLLANNDFEVPESFIGRQIYYMMADAQRRLVSGGMDTKKAAEFSLKLRDQIRGEAIKIVKIDLLLKNIARKEGLSVSEAEVDTQIREIALQRAQDYETFKKSLEKDDLIGNLTSEIISRKTYEFLLMNATVTTTKNEKSAVPEGEK